MLAVQVDSFTIDTHSWWPAVHDTYVDVRYNGLKIGRTSVCKETNEPVWNQCFLAPIDKSAPQHCFWFRIMHQNHILPDKIVLELEHKFTPSTRSLTMHDIVGSIFLVEPSESVAEQTGGLMNKIQKLEDNLHTSAVDYKAMLEVELHKQRQELESKFSDEAVQIDNRWMQQMQKLKDEHQNECEELYRNVKTSVSQCAYLQKQIDKLQDERLLMANSHSDEIARIQKSCELKMETLQSEIDDNEERQRLLVETLIHN